MTSIKNPRSETRNQSREKRLPYHAPAIIYEGEISIRAGTPEGSNFRSGPDFPFNNPAGS